jgi:hypothetical protein
VTWPVALTSSAPIVSTRNGAELTVLLGFDRATREFVVTRREGAGIHPVFVGPSPTLACSGADQALQLTETDRRRGSLEQALDRVAAR